MQVGIKVQVGKLSKINKSTEWIKAMQVGIWNFITINYCFFLRILKSNKSAGWNKGVQVEKLLFNVCCTVIRETKVASKTTVALNRVMKTGEHAS